MKLVGQFDRFLVDVVNINQDRLDQLEERVGAIFRALRKASSSRP